MIQWTSDFKSYILKYFIFDNFGNLIDLDRNKRRSQPLDKYGYKTIKIKGKYYKVHQILYFLYHGKQALNVVDHVDGNKINNRYSNLRDVTQSVNCKNNHKRNNDTGCIGIWCDENTKGLNAKYTTRIKGKQLRFKTLQEAIKVRKQEGLLV